MWYKLSYAIATVFGTGLFPRAGGTATSVVTAIAAYLAWEAGVPGMWVLVTAILVFAAGLAVVYPAELHMCCKWGPRRRHTGEEVVYDFQQTTIDECHGQLVACLPIFFLPGICSPAAGSYFAASLLLFRWFDIFKIWPVNRVERKLEMSSWGIMLDDTVAGVMAALGLLALIWLCHLAFALYSICRLVLWAAS